MMKTLLAALAATALLMPSSCIHSSVSFDETAWRKDVENQETEKLYAPHFEEGTFFNPWMPMERVGIWRLLKWKLFSAKAPYTDVEKAFKPVFVPRLKDRIKAMPKGDFIAWIGHATFLLRLQGEYWLIDPMLSERALLPKRVTPPAITSEELKEVTSSPHVMISHNHYDHLDADTLRALPEGSRFYVPLGLKRYVESLHRGVVKEMDWWEDMDAGHGVKLTCLPAQHWSRRLGQDINRTLWASFLLRTPTLSVYYGGDSGYFVGYREFGRRFPRIDYALLSTTAYHPRWFMHYAHKNIPETLQAFRDLGAGTMIPTQWGTFPLGDEPPGYPALDLKRTLQDRGMDPSRFLLMDIGGIERLRPHQSTSP